MTVSGELFVVGISHRTAPVAVREKLAFREDEIAGVLAQLTKTLPVTEALLVSTCNRVEVYGVGTDATEKVQQFLAADRKVALKDIAASMYMHRGREAVRHVFRVASSLDSLVVGEAQILGQLKAAHHLSTTAGTHGPLLGRCLERAYGAAKRVRSETAIARGAANVSTVAVNLAERVFGDLSGKSVLVVGAGKMSRLAAKHLYASGALRLVVTNRSPAKAEALAGEIDGVARPWEQLDQLLADADVVISSTGAREPILTKPQMKKVMKARKWKDLMIVDIAVPRDADPEIGKLDGVFLFDIDDLDKVVAANLAERHKAADAAAKIVEHEAGQFEQWVKTQGVVPTIRALRAHFAKVAEAEVAKLEATFAKKPHTPEQQREAFSRAMQLVVNKLLHQPTTALREAGDEAELRAAVLCDLFGIEPDARVSQEEIEAPQKKAGTQ